MRLYLQPQPSQNIGYRWRLSGS
ncbi:hypothetical protein cgp_4021 [Corynebacterium glutamicum MB001]|nr:hypothetical protein cgp_4021 [Corynebacterium glutamicum MB001]ASW15345.1 hypothetical protein cgc1_4021 [Corynebacterium glutamicum]QYO75007.1 hypothetical protein cgisf_4021 [Corynebacterium glutamicum]